MGSNPLIDAPSAFAEVPPFPDVEDLGRLFQPLRRPDTARKAMREMGCARVGGRLVTTRDAFWRWLSENWTEGASTEPQVDEAVAELLRAEAPAAAAVAASGDGALAADFYKE